MRMESSLGMHFQRTLNIVNQDQNERASLSEAQHYQNERHQAGEQGSREMGLELSSVPGRQEFARTAGKGHLSASWPDDRQEFLRRLVSRSLPPHHTDKTQQYNKNLIRRAAAISLSLNHLFNCSRGTYINRGQSDGPQGAACCSRPFTMVHLCLPLLLEHPERRRNLRRCRVIFS